VQRDVLFHRKKELRVGATGIRKDGGGGRRLKYFLGGNVRGKLYERTGTGRRYHEKSSGRRASRCYFVSGRGPTEMVGKGRRIQGVSYGRGGKVSSEAQRKKLSRNTLEISSQWRKSYWSVAELGNEEERRSTRYRKGWSGVNPAREVGHPLVVAELCLIGEGKLPKIQRNGPFT